MYLVFYQGNKIKGKAFYSKKKDIPNQHSFIEITEVLFTSKYPLELYEESGIKKVRIDQVKKAEIDAKEAEREAIKQKVKDDEELTNKEMAKLVLEILEKG